MASKSKKARMERIKPSKTWPVIFLALLTAFMGYLQNRYGQFSDIRGFYGTRFMNDQHNWPYDAYTPLGGSGVIPPIEYPVLTGVAIWALTFVTPQAGVALFNYFGLNALINAILFCATAYFIKKITDNSKAYMLAFTPAAVLALNLNWDMWAVLPMIASIYFFESGRTKLSAILLGVAIAAKFFPVVLLLSLFVFYVKERKFKPGIKYLLVVLSTWLVVNLPVMVISYDGWKYFYQFSFSRGFSDGSIYSILSKIYPAFNFTYTHYYVLNILLFLVIIIFLFKSKINLSLAQTAFFAMCCFTYFGKQYSMQYVLWLAPLALISIGKLPKKLQISTLYTFFIWQLFEISFRFTYFQNLMTNYNLGKGLIIKNSVSDAQYAWVGLFRYILFLVFVLNLIICYQKYYRLNEKQTNGSDRRK